jgi:hypothetical protein
LKGWGQAPLWSEMGYFSASRDAFSPAPKYHQD